MSHDPAGEIDTLELEAFLNQVAGTGQWITADQWLFIDPPAEAIGEITLPVIMPVAAATRAVLSDLTNEPARIVTDYQTSPTETRRWRWLAFQRAPNDQGRAWFPWEAALG